MNSKISFFTKVYDKQPAGTLDFDEYLLGVKIGKWEDPVLAFRTGQLKKELIPCVTASGVFSQRSTSGLIEHSGVINIDIDSKENPDIDLMDMRDELYADQFIYAGHVSVSGAGLSLYVRIKPAKHYEAFCALEKYFSNKYNLRIDQKAKDIPRLRFVSLDPDCHINSKAKVWVEYIEKSKQPPRSFGDYITSKDDFEFVMNQIIKKGLNITEDYDDWVKVGLAFASEFGEKGRGHFHAVSSISGKYQPSDCDRKYDQMLKAKREGVTIRTFYWLAKREGAEIKSPRTQRIEQVARIRVKQVGKSGGAATKGDAQIAAIKYLSEVEKIEGDDVKHIVDQVVELSTGDLQKKSDLQMKIDTCMQVINSNRVVYNVITQKPESNGKKLTDNDINSMYIDVIEIDDSVSKDLFNTIINSNRIKSFNPFLDFIEKHSSLRPKGNIQALLDTIDDRMLYNGEEISDYKEIYVKKWLLGLMASIHGTYSLMILVLTGEQMIQKTNWFRWLLPDELQSYYSESKLDAGKDDEILMTQKLLIVDDEFGGKSKQEAKKLKDISSKQYFTIRKPYGHFSEDIKRLAVLGGTSNDDEVLNDPTGNRRIIPLKVKSINIDAYKKIDKTELFMEIYHEWRRVGDGWMLTPQEVKILNDTTLAHEQEVLEYQLIAKYFTKDNSYTYSLTSSDIKVKIEQRTQQRLSLYKIGQSLNKLGYTKTSKREDEMVKQVWNVMEVDPITGGNL